MKDWEKELAEMVYAYNRGDPGYKDEMIFIEDKMHKKLEKFILSLLASEKKALLKRVREEVIGEDEEPLNYKSGPWNNNALRAEQRAKLEQLRTLTKE